MARAYWKIFWKNIRKIIFCRKTPWQISSQKSMLIRYTQDNGFPNPKFYADDNVSDTTFQRNGLKAMMSDIEARKVGIAIKRICPDWIP